LKDKRAFPSIVSWSSARQLMAPAGSVDLETVEIDPHRLAS
jgi:hypothetical protein